MESDRAAAILKGMLDRQTLSAEEKEAVFTAIGILAWVSLSKTRITQLKRKKEAAKQANWGAVPAANHEHSAQSGIGKS